MRKQWIWAGVLAAYFNVEAAGQDGAAFFEKNIRPVLARQCLTCHSSPSSAMGGLRLDSLEAMLKGGGRGPALVPGKPAESLLLAAVQQTGTLRMPPSGKLKDAEIAAFGEWIRMGAPWGATVARTADQKKFWAFVPPVEPKVPEAKNVEWAKTPLDRFVLAGLEAKRLKPAPPADKRTLIRRATYDLTGLPPAPEEVKAFLDDTRPDAFARVVDRLLASKHYGERWGRHWLDVARYADSNGLDENLVYRNAWRYRDYVIQAFNKDKPYDLFVKEQLAGDLLPGPAPDEVAFERWTATGFLSLGAKMLAEDDPVKMEMDIIDEQLDTTARTFMGLTLGCARCHDHKFDPLPQADYYSLAGIFKSSKTMENFKVVAQWHEYVLAPEPERKKLDEHLGKIEAKGKEIGRVTGNANKVLMREARDHVGAYLLAADDVLRYEKTPLRPVAMGALAAGAVRRDAGSFDRGNAPRIFEKGKSHAAKGSKAPYFAEYDVTADSGGDYQLDFLEEETGGGTVDVLVNGVLQHKGKRPVTNRKASEDLGGWSVTGVVPLQAGKNTIRLEHKSRFPYFEALQLTAIPAGKAVPRSSVQVSRQYGIKPGFLDQWVEEMRRSKGAPASVLYPLFAYSEKGTLSGDALAGWTSPAADRFKGFAPKNRQELGARYQELFDEADRAWQKELQERGDKPAPKAERNAVSQEEGLADKKLEAFREVSYAKAGPFSAPPDAREHYPRAVQEQLERLEKEKKDLEQATPDLPHAMGVCESGKVGDLPIHLRGSHWTLGQEVPRRFPRALAGDNQAPLPNDQSGRLQLAEWLTRADHPLTSRVMVNRLWRWHFGRGIVPSVDNFGRLGEAPSNQALLDWLALRFVEQGWSIKQMHRTMMLSATYQMSANYDAKAAEADPENVLLWRMSRRRLEAEAIRDAVTAVTGIIDWKEGGTLLNYKDRQYVADTAKRGAGDFDVPRRAVYIPVVRSSMYEMFQAFDLPDPSTPNGDRNSTVIAPQALFMMNSGLVLKATHTMAEQLLAAQGWDDAGRVKAVYERALSRPPAATDVDRALTFIAQVEKTLEARENDAVKRRLLAWQSFCKALLSSNEFIYVN